MARRPPGDERAIARRVAAVRDRLVGILPTGRGSASHLPAGRLDPATYPEVLLAAVAQCAGSLPQVALGAHAVVDGAALELRAVVVSPDGGRTVKARETGAADQAEALGRQAAEHLLAEGARDIMDAL